MNTRPREVIGALCLLSLLLVVFLWKPLTSGGAYASTDVLQSSPLVRQGGQEPARYGNILLTDPVQQMLPWFGWNREQLRSGQLPVWNPYNGNGVPHLANDQTAALSPFGLPFLVLPLRSATVAAAFLRLLAFGLFTYLFLRVIRLSHTAGLVGAVAFTFGAFHLLWLQFPQPTPVICLPAGLWAAELAIRAGPDRRRGLLASVGFALAVAVGFLTSHPETLFFSLGLVIAYVLLRLAFDRSAPGRQRLVTGGRLCAAAIVGVGLGAVQLLPFLEYLRRSATYAEGGTRALLRYNPRFSIFNAFPDLFGNPSTNYYDAALFSDTLRLKGQPAAANYNEAVSSYIGLLVLFLAGVGLVALLRRWRTRRSTDGQPRSGPSGFPLVFLAVSALIWLAYAYDFGGLSRVVASLPIVRLSAVNRSHPIWLFAVACLAAAGVDSLLRLAPARPRRAAAIVGVSGAALLAVVLVVAKLVHRGAAAEAGNLAATAAAGTATRQHVTFIAVTFMVGVAASATLAGWGRLAQVRMVGVAVLVAMVFTQSGFLLRGYNPTVDRRSLYPDSPALAALTGAAGDHTVSLDNLLFPDTNLQYRIRVAGSYDGMGVKEHQDLLRTLTPFPTALLKATGVHYVATSLPAPMAGRAGRVSVDQALSADQPVSAVFEMPAAGLSGVRVLATGEPCMVTMVVEEAATGLAVGRAEGACRQPGTALAVAPQAASAGRTYRVLLTGSGTVSAVEPYTGGATGLEQLEGSGPVSLFRVVGAPPRYVSPAVALPAGSFGQTLVTMAQPSFDVSRVVLVDGLAGESRSPPGRVRVVSETPTRIRLQVDRESPGWLMALQTKYPGWKATVNGRSVGIRRANAAFMAVPVGAGSSAVELRYDPLSVRLGLAATALSAIALNLALLAALGVRPRPAKPAGRAGAPEPLDHGAQQPASNRSVAIGAACRSMVWLAPPPTLKSGPPSVEP